MSFGILAKYRKNISALAGNKGLTLLLLLLYFFSVFTALAEGSKDMIVSANGNGHRAHFLSYGGAGEEGVPFPTTGIVKVYAEAGETLYLGSSAVGIGSGRINVRAPGSAVVAYTSATAGLIADRARELVGPSLNGGADGGYIPFIVPVNRTGVWEIEFISPSPTTTPRTLGASHPTSVAVGSDWTQNANSSYITAFDVSVRNAANPGFISGRAFMNVFNGTLSGGSSLFYAQFNILTYDGYLYEVDNNGQAGYIFSFFVNNKGFRDTNGDPLYESVTSATNVNTHDPRTDDTATDFTHKIFFNTPAADLPEDADTPTGTTWLKKPIRPLSVSDVLFEGQEGTDNMAGTFPLGGWIKFKASQPGSYDINIDINNNGIFTDNIDIKLTGAAVNGDNEVRWNGLDGDGNKVYGGISLSPGQLQVNLVGGEVHFPFLDVENNVYGIIIKRINGANAPDYTVHWNDDPISSNTNAPDPKRTPVQGVNSSLNGHKYGSTAYSTSAYGNQVGLDTWAYLVSAPQIPYLDITFREADLEVVSLVANKTTYCVGEEMIYTIRVRNNGPDNVEGAQFFFDYPTEFNITDITGVFTTPNLGNQVVSSQTTTTRYSAVLNMINGAELTFTIKGALSSPVTAMDTKASVMRPKDVTDPDATNPDAAEPTDPEVECNYGTAGCNNIKEHSNITFSGVTIDMDGNQTVVEGTGITRTMTFPVTLSASSLCDITVDYVVEHITTNAQDFLGALSGKLTIPAGQTSANISVQIATDNIVERDEEFRVRISNPSGINTIGVASAIGTIENDDTAVINVTKVDGYEEGAVPAKLIFSYANGVTSDCNLEIDFRLGGTAAWGDVDYTGTEFNTVVIPAEQSTFELVLPVNDDAIVEGNETIFIAAVQTIRHIRPENGDPQNDYSTKISLNPTVPTVTIFDNDKATIRISDPVTLNEGNTGDYTDFIFNLTLDNETAGGFTLNFKTADGTALVSDNDYELQNRVVNFTGQPGTYPVTVRVIGDDKIESDEYFHVTISDLSNNYNGNLTITQAASVGNIINDDSGVLDITSLSTTEGGAAAYFEFILHDGKVADTDVIITYTLTGKADGNGIDYDKPQTGTITLLKGQNSVRLYLNTYDDGIVEGTEDVILTVNSLSHPGISLPVNTSTLDILDINQAQITVADVQVTEGNGGTTLLRFKAVLNGRTDRDFTLPFTIQDVTTTLGTDYTVTTISPVSFAPNQATQEVNIDIAVVGDYDIEINETLQLVLGTPSRTFDGRLIVQSSPATGIIFDDDSGQITVTAAHGAEENEEPVVFTFAFPAGGTSATDTRIDFSLAGSTADVGADYDAPLVNYVIIPAGSNSTTLTITVNEDAVIEGTETIVLTPFPITGNPGVTVNTNAVTAQIEDNDTGTITLTGLANVVEGDDSNTVINYTIKLDKEIKSPIQLSYRTADITALAGEDYDGVLDTYTFLPGLSEQEISVPVTIRGDKKIEANELFRFMLNPLLADFGGRLTIVTPFVETTIENDDAANIVINKIDGREGIQDARFIIEFENGYSVDVPINIPYTISGGTAQNPGDYTGPGSGVITINPGQNYAQLDFPVIDDNLLEKTETIVLNLQTASLPYSIALTEHQKTLNIYDNDAASISISNATVTEGNESDTYLVFDVTLTGEDIQDAFSIPFTVTDGTATVNQDYEVPALTTLHFNGAADRSKTIQILVKGDFVIEKDETLQVALGLPSDDFEGRLTITNATATGTIRDNDKGIIQIVPSHGDEEGPVAGKFRFNFLNGITSDEPTTIHFNLGGSADGQDDYTTTNPTSVTIPAGATGGEIEITVINDAKIEDTETVILTTGVINTPYLANISVANSPQTVNILDNDSGELLLTADPDVYEGADGQITIVKFKVKLTAATEEPFSVNYHFVDIEATNGVDYIGTNGVLNFDGDIEEKEVEVRIIGDYKIEADERFRFVISNPSPAYGGKLSVPVNNAVFTILNDDSAQLTITKQDGEEGGNDGFFRISLPADYTLDRPVQISYTLSGAQSGEDYVAVPLTVTLPANTNSIDIPIAIIDDTKIEGDEYLTITANIVTPVYGITFISNTATLKITDNDYGTVSVNNVTVDEQHSGEHTLSFEVTLNADTEESFAVNYHTENGTATAGEDYEAIANGSITFGGVKDEIRHIQVKYYGDRKVEADETFKVILQSLSKTFGGHLSISTTAHTGTATLKNDDTAVVAVDATHGSEDGTKGIFRFYLENGATADKPITINYQLGGTALNVSAKKDYDITHPTTVTIPAGDNYVDVELTIIDDEIVEGTETVKLTDLQLFSDYGSGITLSPNIPDLNIADNDNAQLILTAVDEITEGNTNEEQQYRFTVELSAETADGFSVNYTVADGTAQQSEGDYTINPTGTLTFLGNKDEPQYIDVKINGDDRIEPDEDFTVTLSDPSNNFGGNLTIPVKTKTGIIKNDDFADIVITKNKGAEGGQNAEFIFTLTNNKTVDEDIFINYTLDNASAIEGTDYNVSHPSPLTLPKGSNSVTLTLNIVDDNIVEGTETVKITAQTQNNPRNNISISNPVETLEIADNDETVLTITNPEIIEGTSGETDMQFTVSINKPVQKPFTVRYNTEDDTAIAGEDYTAVTNGQLTFPQGSVTSQTFIIKIKGDRKIEADETFRVLLHTLSDDFGGSLKLPAAPAIGTIKNDDTATIAISGANGREAGETSGEFRFNLLPSGVTSDQPITINYNLLGDAIGNGTDYSNPTTAQSITIPADSQGEVLYILVKDDNILELDESVIINASIAPQTSYTNAISLVNNTHTIYIEDNDNAVLTLSGTDKIIEGDDGFRTLEYTVTLSNPVTAGFKVNYDVEEITAIKDEDFQFTPGEFTFTGTQAGENYKFFIYVRGDRKIEANETFRIVLTPQQTFGNRLTVQNAPLEVEITNDDSGIISITTEDGEERPDNSKPAKFIFSLPDGITADRDIEIPYTLSNNSARAGVDYTGNLTGDKITIKANDNQAVLELPVIDDDIVEDTETITIQLANVTLPYGITLAETSKTLNILDNDEAYLSITNARVVEGNSGTSYLDFTVSLDKQVEKTFTVTYSTENGTAAAGEDYQQIANSSFTFNAMSADAKNIRVSVNTDLKIEADETLFVRLHTLDNNLGGRLHLPADAATGTIENDDSAVIRITETNGKEAGATPGTFKFSLLNNATSDQPITIEYELSGQALGNGTDYLNTQRGSITISAGDPEAVLNIEVIDDNIVELNETVILTANLATGNAYNASVSLESNTQTIEIEDNDTSVLSINGPLSITEGNTGTKDLTFHVTLSNPVADAFTIRYFSRNGTATVEDNDYQSVDGTLSFTGQTVGENYPIHVTINGDTKIEGNEFFEILLDPLVQNYNGNLRISGVPARGIILDDDNEIQNKTITITKQDGKEGINDASFTFSFPPGVSLDSETEIFFSLAGNAVKDEDYEVLGSASSITIPAGQNNITLRLRVIDDAIIEGTEPVNIITANIRNSQYQDISIANPNYSLNILDNDSGTIRVYPVGVDEGNAAIKEMLFNVELSHRIAREITLNYHTEDNTATVADDDYVPVNNGRLVLGPQAGTRQIKVEIQGDVKIEADEILHLILEPLAAADTFDGALTILNNTIAGTILNDDEAVITVTAQDGDEEGRIPVKFKFSFPDGVFSDEPTEISYRLQGGTAIGNGVDYTGTTTGTITIDAYNSSTELVLPVIDDTLIEGPETVIIIPEVNSVYGSAIKLNPVVPQAIIKDNDAAKLRISGPVTVTEGNIGTTPVEFTVTLEGNIGESFNVKYSTQDGTATVADNDYIPQTNRELHFSGASGESHTITIDVNGDRKIEKDEKFFVRLHDLSKTFNGLLEIEGSPAEAIILDDDNIRDNKTITITSTNGSEDGTPVTFTFSFPSGVMSDEPTTIPYALGGEATAGDDYVGAIRGEMIIPAGDNSVTLTLPVKPDDITEGTETVELTTGEVINGNYADIVVLNSPAVAEIADLNKAYLTIEDVEINEGDTGTKTVEFTVKLNGTTSKPFTVDYKTEDGTAIKGEDYNTITGELSFNGIHGDERKIQVVVNGDKKLEADETFRVILENIKGVKGDFSGRLTLDRAEATATIKNDDNLVITVTGEDGAEAGRKSAKFIFSLQQGYTADIPTVINYTLGGQATAGGTDYSGDTRGVIAIPAGEERIVLELPVVDDEIIEDDETIEITINSINTSYPANVSYNPLLPVIKIVDNDFTILRLSGSRQQPETNSGTTTFFYTITLEKSTGSGFTLKYTTEDGTATVADNDYIKTENTLSFSGNAGESHTIPVFVNGDQKIEGNEEFTFRIFDLEKTFNNRLSIPVTSVKGIIENDDSSTITVTAVDGIEGAQDGKFVLTLAPGVTSDRDITIHYRLGGTASNSDYQALPSATKVTIPAGQNSAEILINVTDDNYLEERETVVLTVNSIENPYNNVTMALPVPVLYIHDNDITNLTIISPAAVTEKHSGTSAVTFNVRLESPTDKAFNVNYTTVDGTATVADNDYRATSGTLRFAGAAGETKSVTVLINGDTKPENDETFGLRLSGLLPDFDGKLIIGADGIATILNDDENPIAKDDAVMTNEDTPVTFSVTVNDTHAEGIDPKTVTIVTKPGKGVAVANGDGTVTYTPNKDVNGYDSFTYTVKDNFGRLSNTALVNITIIPVNDAPVANDDVFYVKRDSSIRENVSLNDYDVDGDVLTFNIIEQPKYGAITFFDAADGTFIYVPNADYKGRDTLRYHVIDPEGLKDTAEVRLLIQPKVRVDLAFVPSSALGVIIEGDTIAITAKLDDFIYQDVNVVFNRFGGTAEVDKDYTLSENYDVITIPAGKTETTQKFVIHSIRDNLKEGDETIEIPIFAVDPSEFVTIGDGVDIIIKDFYPEDKAIGPDENGDINPDPMMSPNGDGEGNEVFVIYNIERYPDNEVTIYNRWGNEVYTIKGYNNKDVAFNGNANTGMFANKNEPLVDGVYFFIIHTKNAEGKPMLNKGYVIMRR